MYVILKSNISSIKLQSVSKAFILIYIFVLFRKKVKRCFTVNVIMRFHIINQLPWCINDKVFIERAV